MCQIVLFCLLVWPTCKKVIYEVFYVVTLFTSVCMNFEFYYLMYRNIILTITINTIHQFKFICISVLPCSMFIFSDYADYPQYMLSKISMPPNSMDIGSLLYTLKILKNKNRWQLWITLFLNVINCLKYTYKHHNIEEAQIFFSVTEHNKEKTKECMYNT